MTAPDTWHDTPDLVGDHVRLVALAPDHAEGLLAAADDDEWPAARAALERRLARVTDEP